MKYNIQNKCAIFHDKMYSVIRFIYVNLAIINGRTTFLNYLFRSNKVNANYTHYTKHMIWLIAGTTRFWTDLWQLWAFWFNYTGKSTTIIRPNWYTKSFEWNLRKLHRLHGLYSVDSTIASAIMFDKLKAVWSDWLRDRSISTERLTSSTVSFFRFCLCSIFTLTNDFKNALVTDGICLPSNSTEDVCMCEEQINNWIKD